MQRVVEQMPAAESVKNPVTAQAADPGETLADFARTHGSWLVSQARFLMSRSGLGSSVAAEDVAQGAFLRLIEWWRGHATEVPKRPHAFLTRLLQCELKDICRYDMAQKRGGARSSCRAVSLDAATGVPTRDPTPTFVARFGEFISRTRGLLSSRQHSILVGYISGLDAEAISRQLKTSPGRIRAELSRLLQRLEAERDTV